MISGEGVFNYILCVVEEIQVQSGHKNLTKVPPHPPDRLFIPIPSLYFGTTGST